MAIVVALPVVALADGDELKCKSGAGDACSRHANLLWEAGRKRDALQVLRRGCDLNAVDACWALGAHLEQDDNVKDARGAASAYQRACSTVDGAKDCVTDCRGGACTSGFATCLDGCDSQRGDAYYACAATCDGARQSCAGGCDAQCGKNAATPQTHSILAYSACRSLGAMYAEGRGVRKDPERAKRLRALADTNSAQVLAEADASEIKNVREHPEYYRDAEKRCRSGEPDHCFVATPLYDRRDPEVSVELLTIMLRAKPKMWGAVSVWADKMARLGKRDFVIVSIDEMCSGGVTVACTLLGFKYKPDKFGREKDWPKDAKLAASYLDKGCTGGDRLACIALGDVSTDPKVKERAAQLQKEFVAEGKASIAKFQDKWRQDATRELAVQKQIEPYLPRLWQLLEELQAQKSERIAHDRLPPDQLRAFDPAVTNEDIAAASAWKQRRTQRRYDIGQWLEDIGDDLETAR